MAHGNHTDDTLHPADEGKPSQIMVNILQTVERIAASDLGVLIAGEEGTEQEWLARTIHRMSSRSGKEFVRVDCFSRNFETLEKEIFGFEEPAFTEVEITRGALEEAAGGSIFLMNISDLAPALYAKLAKSLTHQHFRRVGGQRELPINVRVIATLSRSPSDISSSPLASKDAFQRICPVIINLPPLRERREDIPILIRRILRELTDQANPVQAGIHPAALEICCRYDWPGNALELQRAITHAAAVCDGRLIRMEHLPLDLRQAAAGQSIETARHAINA